MDVLRRALNVIHAQSKKSGDSDDRLSWDISQSRVAVAELIEAAKVLGVRGDWSGGDWCVPGTEWRALLDAIERCGGAP